MRRILPILMAMAVSSRSAGACSRVNPMPAVDQLVARADAIVVATAARYEIQPAQPGNGLIEFDVEEILSGHPQPIVRIDGRLVARDDFNDKTPPYTFVRPAGRHGDCHASEYREGGRFLLLLKQSRDGSLTPYWEALAPTNEQLHGPDDPWLTIVRKLTTAGARR
jgi:hypothetical protein